MTQCVNALIGWLKSSNVIANPFTEDFDYKAIRQMCRDYEKEHPLDKKYINESSFTMTLY